MSSYLHKLYAYKFVKLLTTDWENTDAYKLGIIDRDGDLVKSPETSKEKDAYNTFYRLVFNIKRLMEKFPLGKLTVARYAAAMYLLKEHLENKVENFKDFEAKLLEITGADDIDLNESADNEILGVSESALKEDVSTGNIDGGVSAPNRVKPADNFASGVVFDCDTKTLMQCRLGKKRKGWWKKFTGDTELGQSIAEYAKKNPKRDIVLRDKTGAMMYVKRSNWK